MKPLCSGLLLGIFALVTAIGCVPSTAQTPYGTARTSGSARTWATARGLTAPAAPFRGAKYRTIQLPFRDRNLRLAFSPDGKKVAVASLIQATVWDTESGKEVTRFNLSGSSPWLYLTWTADGSHVVTASPVDTEVLSWNATTGTKDKAWQPTTIKDPTGRGVLAIAAGGDRALFSARQGKDRYPVYGHGKNDPVTSLDPTLEISDAVFFGDKATVGVRTRSQFKAIDTRTGKTRWEAPSNWPASPSGLRLAVGEKFALIPEQEAAGQHYSVRATEDGKEWCRIPLVGYDAALSADGRVAVVAGTLGLHLFDLWAEKEVIGFHASHPSCVAVAASPDGKTLAVLGWSETSGTALYLTAYPTLPLTIHPKTDLSAEEETEYWRALTSSNLFRRKYAEDVLLARPDQTIAIAARRLVPVPDIERLRAEDLVQNLSDPDPEFRARVAVELERYAVSFQPLLIATHEKATGDAKAKLATVLKIATSEGLPTSVGADHRGLELLERLGTPAARAYLTKLASGAKGARLTESATAALKRLETKPQ